jgi:hypothetical protein
MLNLAAQVPTGENLAKIGVEGSNPFPRSSRTLTKLNLP